jgi:CHAT domain-containing protein
MLVIFCITAKGLTKELRKFNRATLIDIPNLVLKNLANIEHSKSKTEHVTRQETFNAFITEMSATLFVPIEPCLKGITSLIIIPHLGLHYFPFCLLTDSTGAKLVEKYEITIRHSPKSPVTANPPGTGGLTDMLLVYNPTGTNLTHAESEAKGIKQILPQTHVLSGKTAVKHDILNKIKTVSAVHFACHAAVNETRPMFSHLCVTDNQQRPARIEVNEIYDMTIKADLVVLNCCSSGKGNTVSTDDMVCFSRAFLLAGAKNVLVTLWDIFDQTTSEFIQHFYKELVVNHKSKPAALRSAQLYMIQQNRSAYHWAAFHLIGY